MIFVFYFVTTAKYGCGFLETLAKWQETHLVLYTHSITCQMASDFKNINACFEKNFKHLLFNV